MLASSKTTPCFHVNVRVRIELAIASTIAAMQSNEQADIIARPIAVQSSWNPRAAVGSTKCWPQWYVTKPASPTIAAAIETRKKMGQR